MPKTIDTVSNGLMLVYIAIFAVAAYFNWRYRARLRKNHATTWAELGSPSIFNSSISNGLKSTGFLLKKDFEKLGDPELTGYGLKARAGLICIFLYLLAIAGLMLFVQYQNGVWKKPVVVTGSPMTMPVIALLGFVVFSFIPYALFLNRLKNHHQEKWDQLGQPTFLNQTISNQWAWSRFFWSCKYLDLKDTRLNMYAAAIWIMAIGVIVALSAKNIAE